MKIFSTASRFLDKKTTIPVLGLFRLDFKDGSVTVTSTNLDKTFSATVPCECNDGSVLVDGVRLASFLNTVDGVSFEVGDKLTVKHSKGKASFAVTPIDTFPKVPTSIDGECVSIDGLAEAFKAVLCGTDADKVDSANFRNVCELRIESGKFTCTTWDEKRLVVATGEAQGRDCTIQIPIRAVQTLQTLVNGIVEIRESDNHLFFVVDGQNFVFRKLTTKFPNVVELMSKAKFEYGFTCPADELGSALETVHSLMDARLKSVKWTLGDDLTLSINNSEVGHVEQHVAVSPELQLETGYNLTWLLPIVRQLEGDITCEFMTQQSPYALRIVQDNVSFMIGGLSIRN